MAVESASHPAFYAERSQADGATSAAFPQRGQMDIPFAAFLACVVQYDGAQTN